MTNCSACKKGVVYNPYGSLCEACMERHVRRVVKNKLIRAIHYVEEAINQKDTNARIAALMAAVKAARIVGFSNETIKSMVADIRRKMRHGT